jgi:predicted lipid-binding transport protein (Tim44 family)
MKTKFRWKRPMLIAAVLLMANFMLMETSAWARAGGGSRSGSRGSRSYSAPSMPSSRSPSTRPTSPYSQPSPGSGSYVDQPSSSSFGRSSFGQGLTGGLVGGLLGNMLFSGRGYAGPVGSGQGGSSVGLLDMILIGLVIYFFFKLMRRRRNQLAAQSGYQSSLDYQQPPGYGSGLEPPVEMYGQPEIPPEARNLQSGLEQIRRSDPGFTEAQFVETAQDLFFRIQAAWMNRSLDGVQSILVEEMSNNFLIEFAEMKQKGQTNRLENIAVRRVDITEAWQEHGTDYITVLFTANLLDYTVDDKTGQVVAGDRNVPVKFEEFWTFCRLSGQSQWALAGINQK